jgi:hypothetical protein
MNFSGYVVVCVDKSAPERLVIEITPNFVDFISTRNGFLIFCQGVVCLDKEYKSLTNEIKHIRIKILENMIVISKDTNFQRCFELLIKEILMDTQIVANKYTWKAII